MVLNIQLIKYLENQEVKGIVTNNPQGKRGHAYNVFLTAEIYCYLACDIQYHIVNCRMMGLIEKIRFVSIC
jgi:hypothetical protein